MHIKTALTLALCAVPLCAQTPPDPEILRAQSEVAHTQELVQAGAAPRAQLESALQSLIEAQENVFLRRTLYGADVTEAEAGQMVELTAKRLARRHDAVVKMQELADAGVVARLSLSDLLEQEESARKEHDYAVTRAKLIGELAAMAEAEARLDRNSGDATGSKQIAERYDGKGTFTSRDFTKVSRAFVRAFAKDLPVSAYGSTSLHRSLGFDHRGRVDVAVNPDQPEGVWLREYLARNRIPYFAFRAAVSGKATGPHIHLGPMSTPLEGGG